MRVFFFSKQKEKNERHTRDHCVLTNDRRMKIRRSSCEIPSRSQKQMIFILDFITELK